MMVVSYTSGVLHSVPSPSPPSQNGDDRILFLNGLLPTINWFLPGLPWVMRPDRCVLLYENAPILSAKADAFIGANGIFPLRPPPEEPRVPTYRGGAQ